MKYTESLKKNIDFQIVYNYGKSYANKYLVLYIIKNNNIRELNIRKSNKLVLNDENNNLGISVSKKVGNSIVRHRITRLIRESFRLNEENIKRGYSFIFIARPNVKGKSYFEVESALLHLLGLSKGLNN
ncbi:MAG: ribonuclease P protein component [Lachnospiraceae bacterium]|jgi:ribonuclease P protein component|nr:ribonuclease P protein component [Lachnospiraceae bacterium]